MSSRHEGPDRSLMLLARAIMKASVQHVGGIASAYAVGTALQERGVLTAGLFQRCLAASRLTPGTNLLAFYTAIGYQLARWPGAIAALTLGTTLPAIGAAVLAAVYIHWGGGAAAGRFMDGASVAALGVIAVAAIRLLRGAADWKPARGAALAITILILGATHTLSPLMLALLAGGVGAATLRGAS